MTSIYSTEFEMDLSHLDDKMELGASPFPQLDDIDFEFEPVQDLSVDRNMDEDAEGPAYNTDPMQDDTDNVYNDDDMLDEDTIQRSYDVELEDLNMESYNTGENEQHDEEFLYDEEEPGPVQVDESLGDVTVQEPIVQDEYTETNAEDQEEDKSTIYNNDSNTNYTLDPAPSNDKDVDEDTTEAGNDQSPTQVREKDTNQTNVVDFAPQEEDFETEIASSKLEETLLTSTKHNDEDQTLGANKVEEEAEPSQNENADDTFTIENNKLRTGSDSNNAVAEGDSTSGSTQRLHPITVLYLGQELSFFPPTMDDSSATFFLSDAGLAHEPVETLLSACRDILGETLEHDDELVLDVPALGLHICEDSKYASQITLSQVVEVYMHLSRNENLDNIEPLYCNLSSRVCLASQYTYLATSAAEGKTFSEIAADYADSPEQVSELYDDHVNENGDDIAQKIGSIQEDAAPEPVIANVDSQHVTRSPGDEQQASIQSTEQTEIKEAELVKEPTNRLPDEADTITVSEAIDDSIGNHAFDEASETQDPVDLDASLQYPDLQADELGSQQLSNEDQPGDNDEVAGGAEEDSSSSNSHTLEGEGTLAHPEEHHVNDGENEANTHLAVVEEELSNGHLEQDVHANEVEATTDTITAENVVEAVDDQLQSQATADAADAQQSETLPEENLDADDLIDYGQDDSDDEIDLLESVNATSQALVTPSKMSGGKRKAAIEEDDLDNLDLSTPEPKRTRAS